MICPQCGFELKFYEDKCPLCEHKLEQKDYDENNKQVKAESKVTLLDNIKDIIFGKDETSIYRKIILFLFLILLILAILFVIGAFVPSIGHFMDCFFELSGKLYDFFWSLFGLKPPQPSINPNNKGDIRRIFTGVIIIVIINYLFVKAKYVFNKEYYK